MKCLLAIQETDMADLPDLSQVQCNELIEKFNYNELNDLRARIAERMKHMRESGVEQMRLKFIEDAAALGLSPEDIIAAPKKQRRKRRKHKEEELDDNPVA